MVERYDHNWYENEMEQCEGCDYVLHSDYAALERELAELREAVRWERECEDFKICGPARYIQRLRHLAAARAAVDTLIGGE